MIGKFISKIQNSDDNTKKLWVAVFSVITMVVVIALWSAYLNWSIVRVDDAGMGSEFAAGLETQKQKETLRGPGFFATFFTGAKNIFEEVKNEVANKIATTNTIVIENQERNFTLENLEKISPTKLP
ncbi:MAG: hypothetical protein HYT03_00090 [Candidatus Harrisonbacteria bacterium]|nr:hypothetical protein [Candidatus Harrisonbacteria bacterium]